MSSRLTSIAVSAALFCVPIGAQSLSGTFVDSFGNPVPNVAVIMSNGAPTGTSNASGSFLITGLRNRDYDIQIDPHNDTLAPQAFTFVVSGAASLGTVVLQPGASITGVAVGPGGTGLLGVNLNAYELDGTKLFTPHDGTDAFGNFNIVVPVGDTVNIRAVPPVGSSLVPYEQEITAIGPMNLGTVTLPQGYNVTGVVIDEINSLPISGCEIITTNMLTGEIAVQLNKRTNTLGAFTALLPFGLWQIDIVPPLGNLHLARQVFGLAVTSFPHNLGLQRLKRTVILQGQVVGPNGPVQGADIDIYTDDGYKLFTPSDNTNAAGVFAVLVPTGSYRIRVDPLPGTGLAGTITGLIPVGANTNAGVINLVNGVQVQLTFTDFGGNPIPDATMKLTDPVSGQEAVVPGNHADANGVMTATVAPGFWNVRLDGPQGSSVSPATFANIPVFSPVSLTVPLAPKTVFTDLEGQGILTVPNGGEIFMRWTFGNQSNVTRSVIFDSFVELPSGATVPWVPNIPADLPPQSQLTLVLWFPTPIVPQDQLDRVLRYKVRFRDPATLAVYDEAYIHYVAK